MSRQAPIRVIEFYAGLGGLASAWPEANIVAAIDINTKARQVYERNHAATYWIREVESLSALELLELEADFWWLSPPCQPFTKRGKGRDVEDPRCKSLLHLIDLLPQCCPAYLMLENVLGFEDSRAHQLLVQQLEQLGYFIELVSLCPTDFGWPNRRPRIYLLAIHPSRQTRAIPIAPAIQDSPAIQACSPTMSISSFVLDPSDLEEKDEMLWLSAETQATKLHGLDRVNSGRAAEVTACFASSYGKSLLHSGSYLEVAGRFRRFCPREVARFLGYPDYFDLGEDLPNMTTRNRWKLLGNGLSLVAVRKLLSYWHDLTGHQLAGENPCFEPGN